MASGAWSDDEVNYLVAHIHTVPIREIAAHLTRRVERIREKLFRMGIKRTTSDGLRLRKVAATANVKAAGGKSCSKCGEWKPLSEYRTAKRDALDGYKQWCTACCRDLYTEWRLANPKAHAERNARYYHATLERSRPLANKNGRLYRQRHPERARAICSANQAKRRAAEGAYTSSGWLDLQAQYDHRCLCCGLSEPAVKLVPDHIVPIAKGGSSWIANIQPLCGACNSRKGAKIIDYRTEVSPCLP